MDASSSNDGSEEQRSNDEQQTSASTTLIVNAVGAHLEATETFDDVDEDEAFINELMALHPNDEDIVVEDLEEAAPAFPVPLIVTPLDPSSEGEEATEDGVSEVCLRF